MELDYVLQERKKEFKGPKLCVGARIGTHYGLEGTRLESRRMQESLCSPYPCRLVLASFHLLQNRS